MASLLTGILIYTSCEPKEYDYTCVCDYTPKPDSPPQYEPILNQTTAVKAINHKTALTKCTGLIPKDLA